MSLANIIVGVSAPVPPVPQGEVTVQQFSQNRSAVGSSFKDFTSSFASLTVYDERRRDPVNTSNYDGRLLVTPTAKLDYIIIQSLTETHVERSAPVYTFGTSYMYTSGRDAKQFVYTGFISADKISGNNPGRFVTAYNNALRASKLVDTNQPRYVELTYRDQIRRGYLTTLSTNASSQTLNRIDLSFTMFVTDTMSLA